VISFLKVQRNDLVTGILVVVVLISGILLFKNANSDKIEPVPEPTPSVYERVNNKFGNLDIPDDADRAELDDVSGKGGIGISTRRFMNGKLEMTVLADLPEPESGYFYQAWLVKGEFEEEDAEYLSLSKMRIAKGGFVSEFVSLEELSDYKGVVVTLEKNFDQKPEELILKGSF
jgi:hypothetical protein